MSGECRTRDGQCITPEHWRTVGTQYEQHFVHEIPVDIESASPTEDAKLVDLAREAPMNGLTIRDIVNAAVARGIAEEVMGDEDDFAAALDAITEDAVAAVAKLVEIAINQQGINAQFGIAAWELVELIFQAPVMNMDRPEPEEKSA